MEQPGSRFTDAIGLLDRLPDVKVAVVGDVMLDKYVYGDVARISPEAPVPVLRIKSESAMPGGAGNVLANLRGLETHVMTVGVIGEDAAGHALLSILGEKGDAGAGLVRDPERPTTIKTRFLAGGQQLLRADAEIAAPVGRNVEDALAARAAEAMDRAGALILSDYGKGTLTPSLLTRLIAMARGAGIPVLVDPKGDDYSIYSGADIVTPNRKELAQATGGMATSTDDDIVRACRALMKQSGIRAVIATRSQDGMSIVTEKGEPVHLRTEALEVFDVSGAGDTVIATIAALMAAGADLTEAASIANTAGGIVVAKVGTASIRRSELRDALMHKDLAFHEPLERRGASATIIDRARAAMIARPDEAREQIERWKARGLKVGWTNGCFDILHAGHVGYLNRARDRCDRLVLGLNSDASVKRLKGPTRPVNDEQARAVVMAGLGSIDMVVLFGDDPKDDDKPVRMVSLLKPDIIFKGGDYTEAQLPEAAAARAYGGDVMIMPMFEGYSTTSTIKRMQG